MWPIQLPYGLSVYHRHVKKEGKGPALPYGERPCWQVLTLQQISSTSAVSTTPPRTSEPTSCRQQPSSQIPRGPWKRRRRSSYDGEMGVAGSASRPSKAATVAAKEKRKKTPKPQSRCASAGQNVAGSALVKKRDRTQRQKPFGPGTRPGAHQDLPIIIDSDDEAESVASLETSASATVRYDALSPSTHAKC